MGNFEKLSVLVIVVIIVMILVVAIYTWQDTSPENDTATGETETALNVGTGDEFSESNEWKDWGSTDPDPDPEPVKPLGEGGELPAVASGSDSTTPVDPVGGETPTDPAPESATEWVYTVKGGDALSLIAQRELGTIRRQRDILSLNPGLDADRLTVGQKLRMPPKGAVGPAVVGGTGGAMRVSEGDTTGATPKPGGEYTTRGRERLAQISKQAFGTIERWPEIFALNKDLIRNPNDIPPGTTLKLPRR